MANRVNSIMIHGDNFKAFRKLSDADKLALIEALMRDVEQVEYDELSPRADVVKDYIDEQNARFRKGKRTNPLNDDNADNGGNTGNSPNGSNAGNGVNPPNGGNADNPYTRARAGAISVAILPDEDEERARDGSEDAERPKCFARYDTLIQPITERARETLQSFLDDGMEDGAICDIIAEAHDNDGKTLKYVRTALQREYERGIRTRAHYAESQKRWKERRGGHHPNEPPSDISPNRRT